MVEVFGVGLVELTSGVERGFVEVRGDGEGMRAERPRNWGRM